MINICKNNTLVSRSVSNNTRNYHEFSPIVCLKHIMKSPTKIICRDTSLIDYILENIPHKFHSMVSLMLVYLTINLSTVQGKLIKSKQGVFTNI